jgi:hypothetical protein
MAKKTETGAAKVPFTFGKKINVRLVFLEGVLGTSPANKELYKEYIATKAPDASTIEEEVAAIGQEAVAEKGMTVFHRLKDGTPFLYDYQCKGFFKSACYFMGKLAGSESSKVKAYKKKVDGMIFPRPRAIPYQMAGTLGILQRPLRTSGPNGERVALAISEEVPKLSTVEFTIEILDRSDEALVKEWLNFGFYNGIGQWRNSGKGRFVWEDRDTGEGNMDLMPEYLAGADIDEEANASA